ncbi:hypothetical protein CONPUDRAFT_132784 [Coniophora puteana RWD-64-598 SS2]|uniref:GST N-terminal domain-containing protein n=1 Tax=Coniophora puteana (strain RWD-64-598) TaxID=741705 RepID=R7SEH6_CONPW|nr:uncharacterized protein CONPUDRAFT_132784 [Coniophora puteana RWD-64-598 SS2]EIW74586.1 hypothetical protein CONPUDRAFT_132784 [Coniophora puteana RWD-64-598 SS2]
MKYAPLLSPTTMQPLVLYDIPGEVPDKSGYWSPNAAKCRYAIRYKRLPYETRWVAFPDIESTMRALGASPTGKRNGKDVYTVPVLQDPNTGVIVSDSFAIAEYVDRVYPTIPDSVFESEGEKALIKAFDDALGMATRGALRWMMVCAKEVMVEEVKEWFVTMHEERLGMKWEEISPAGSELRREQKDALKAALDVVDGWYRRSGNGKWVQGDRFSYADCLVGAYMFWYSRVLAKEDWEEVSEWNRGRWAKVLKDVEEVCDGSY